MTIVYSTKQQLMPAQEEKTQLCLRAQSCAFWPHLPVDSFFWPLVFLTLFNISPQSLQRIWSMNPLLPRRVVLECLHLQPCLEWSELGFLMVGAFFSSETKLHSESSSPNRSSSCFEHCRETFMWCLSFSFNVVIAALIKAALTKPRNLWSKIPIIHRKTTSRENIVTKTTSMTIAKTKSQMREWTITHKNWAEKGMRTYVHELEPAFFIKCTAKYWCSSTRCGMQTARPAYYSPLEVASLTPNPDNI